MAGPIVRSISEIDNAPDIYVEEFWFGSNPIGAVMTLLVHIPPQPGTSGPPASRIVGRVRMPAAVAADLARIIGEQMPVPTAQPDTGPKN